MVRLVPQICARTERPLHLARVLSLIHGGFGRTLAGTGCTGSSFVHRRGAVVMGTGRNLHLCSGRLHVPFPKELGDLWGKNEILKLFGFFYLYP